MKTSIYLILVLVTIGSQGCITRTHHVKIDPIHMEADIASPEVSTKFGAQIIDTFLGSGSIAEQITAGSLSYRVREGRWPKTVEEVTYGLHLIKPDSALLEKNMDLQFKESDTDILTIYYESYSGESGTLTLDPIETNRPNKAVLTTSEAAPPTS